MLTLCCPDKVLVLHLRGASNKHSSDVLLSALYLVREACLRNQPIHLHSLTGFQHDVEEWLQEFPNCYFGFTGKAPSFSSEQLFDLQSVFIMMWKSGCRKSPTAILDLPGKFPASAVNNSGLQSVPAKKIAQRDRFSLYASPSPREDQHPRSYWRCCTAGSQSTGSSP